MDQYPLHYIQHDIRKLVHIRSWLFSRGLWNLTRLTFLLRSSYGIKLPLSTLRPNLFSIWQMPLVKLHTRSCRWIFKRNMGPCPFFFNPTFFWNHLSSQSFSTWIKLYSSSFHWKNMNQTRTLTFFFTISN